MNQIYNPKLSKYHAVTRAKSGVFKIFFANNPKRRQQKELDVRVVTTPEIFGKRKKEIVHEALQFFATFKGYDLRLEQTMDVQKSKPIIFLMSDADRFIAVHNGGSYMIDQKNSIEKLTNSVFEEIG